MEALPTVEEIAAWMRLPRDVDALVKAAQPWSVAARQALMGVFTSYPISVYWDPEQEKSAVVCEHLETDARDVALVLSAVGDLPLAETVAPWSVKIAWTPAMTRSAVIDVDELPATVKLAAAGLASGRLGVGLGYCLDDAPSEVLVKVADYLDSLADDRDVRDTRHGPEDVNIDALGRTLWEAGDDPRTAGVTMSALAAASQMPGGTPDSGWVTPVQMAELAARMGAGYASGRLVGATLGLLTGLSPQTQEMLGRTGMTVAIAKAVIPKLFSR